MAGSLIWIFVGHLYQTDGDLICKSNQKSSKSLIHICEMEKFVFVLRSDGKAKDKVMFLRTSLK